MNLNAMLAAPEVAPTVVSPTSAGAYAGLALFLLFLMLYLMGTSQKRVGKLPKINSKRAGKKKRQIKVQQPIGPFHPKNWEEEDESGGMSPSDQPPTWLILVTLAAGVIDMFLFMKIKELDSGNWYAKPAEWVQLLTAKVSATPMFQSIDPVWMGIFVLIGVVWATRRFGLELRVTFFLGLAVAGLVVLGGGMPTLFLQGAAENGGALVNSVVVTK